MGKQAGMNEDGNGIDHGDKRPTPERRQRARTRAEAMGIGPDLPQRAQGEAPAGKPSRDARDQLQAAEKALEAARAEARESADRHLRLAAEMDNMRRRHRQEQLDRLQYGNAELITKLLPVLDNFHRALDHAEEGVGGPVEQLRNGLLMVVKQFEDILASEGVTPIETEGKFFDPNLHQAVLAEASPDHEEGQIISELQRGYTLHDRVLRPSMVKVARNI
jgi:molecular chaperone GrpE